VGKFLGRLKLRDAHERVGSIRVTDIYSHVKNCSTRS
jgi:hypothetical protein